MLINVKSVYKVIEGFCLFCMACQTGIMRLVIFFIYLLIFSILKLYLQNTYYVHIILDVKALKS